MTTVFLGCSSCRWRSGVVAKSKRAAHRMARRSGYVFVYRRGWLCKRCAEQRDATLRALVESSFMDKLKNLPWPLAAVLIAGLACFTVILLWGPPDIRPYLFGANGIVWTIVAHFLESPQQRRARMSSSPPPPTSGDLPS